MDFALKHWDRLTEELKQDAFPDPAKLQEVEEACEAYRREVQQEQPYTVLGLPFVVNPDMPPQPTITFESWESYEKRVRQRREQQE
jgi:branched-subunit amino acid aminotransferase/4-amino-4-deoxychorismate lyase